VIWGYLSSIFYGWIPTNKGKLEYSYISIPSFLDKFILKKNTNIDKFEVEVNLDFMDDAYFFKKFSKSKIETIRTIAELVINKSFSGNLVYKNDDDYVRVDFQIEENGKIEFTYLAESDFFDSEIVKQSMFVLVKLFVHGDAHHHQKLDTVLLISETFDELKISNSILSHIKDVERNAKKNNACFSKLKNENSIQEALGYLAYLKTFHFLFKHKQNKKDFKNDIKLSKNIISSLKSNIKNRKNKQKHIIYFFAGMFTFIGLFLSVNLLLNGFHWESDMSFESWDRYYVLIGTLLFILFTFYLYIKCNVKSYMYYSHYNSYDIIKTLRDSDLKNLNFLGKFIKISPIVLLLLSLFLIVYI